MHRGFATAFVLGLSATWLVSAARAGVTYTSQERKVSASAGSANDSQSAMDFGTFDGEATADGSNADFTTTAHATQHSVLDQSGLSFTGRREFEVVVLNPNPQSSAGFGASALIEDTIAFTLDQSTPFTFTRSQTTEVATGAHAGDSGFSLTRANGQVNFQDAFIPASGTLPAGDYTFGFSVESTNSTPRDPTPGKLAVTYDIALQFPAQTGGGGDGGGPTPVPLPPGAWTGLATFGLVGFAWLRHRRPAKLAAI